MDLEAQAKLASALENGSFLRIGGKEPVRVNVRWRPPPTAIWSRRWRSGGSARSVLSIERGPIKLPPLRDHIEDVPELLNYYIGYFVDQEGLTYRHFTLAAQNRLRNYNWPGNIRELKNWCSAC